MIDNYIRNLYRSFSPRFFTTYVYTYPSRFIIERGRVRERENERERERRSTPINKNFITLLRAGIYMYRCPF